MYSKLYSIIHSSARLPSFGEMLTDFILFSIEFLMSSSRNFFSLSGFSWFKYLIWCEKDQWLFILMIFDCCQTDTNWKWLSKTSPLNPKQWNFQYATNLPMNRFFFYALLNYLLLLLLKIKFRKSTAQSIILENGNVSSIGDCQYYYYYYYCITRNCFRRLEKDFNFKSWNNW